MATPSHASQADLDTYRWANRLVLSFIPDGHSDAARRQRDNRRAAVGDWRDRDLLLIEVGPGQTVHVNQESHAALDADALRDMFAVDRDRYVAVLVGKDGYEKLRSAEAIPNTVLFDTIDAMPMRRQEMQSR